MLAMRHPELALAVQAREGGGPLPFTVRRIICGGYTSRDPAEVERHMRELEALGIPRPDAAPTFFSVASYLATTAARIEVQGPFTSGEVEFVLLFGPQGPWVTVGSDQTDRFFERHSMLAGKQLCPKVIGTTVWPLGEVEDHWDELTLRSWVRSGRMRQLYQEAPLGAHLEPAALLPRIRRYAGRELEGVAFFSGTVPTRSGEVIYGDAYELELADPRLDRVIRTQYTVHVLEATRR
ncbi:MAG TPA: DUF2848 family protein [Solirubrobacterales bacterium]|nr:DUF2848 family protein [Solirubrobacterales bacterium]